MSNDKTITQTSGEKIVEAIGSMVCRQMDANLFDAMAANLFDAMAGAIDEWARYNGVGSIDELATIFGLLQKAHSAGYGDGLAHT